MTDASLCPYRKHNGLLIECNYRDVICKRQLCPYFPTLEQAKESHRKMWKEVGKEAAPIIDEMKRRAKQARKDS